MKTNDIAIEGHDRTGEFLEIVHPAACPPTYG
jgi:hypothetical protein